MIRLYSLIFAFFVASFPAQSATEIQEFTSPGGIKAWLVEEPSIPMLAIEIGFVGGTSLDPADKQGVTYLMSGLLEEGTGDLDSEGFAQARENLAARFGFDVNRDTLTISAQVLTENKDAALALLKGAISAPSFDQVAIDRVKGQVLSGIASRQTDAGFLARRELNRQIYGDHPYGYLKEGTEASINSISREDLVAAHKGAIAKDRVMVGVVGDITVQELGPLLDNLLGDLPASGAPLPKKAEFGASGGITVVDLDQPQSQAIWEQSGIDQNDPDYFAAVLVNHVLGGGTFSSRLMEEVREKRGLTYGIGSYLSPRDYSATMGGSVASANDTIAQAIDLVRIEWDRMAKEGPTQEELDAAKKYLTGAYPLRFDGNGRIASILVGMQMIGLDADYPATRNERVWAVTLEDTKRVAKRVLDADALRFVVVGRPEGLESTE